MSATMYRDSITARGDKINNDVIPWRPSNKEGLRHIYRHCRSPNTQFKCPLRIEVMPVRYDFSVLTNEWHSFLPVVQLGCMI